MGNKYIDNDEQLNNILHDISKKVVQNVSQMIVQEVKRQIDENVYIHGRNFYARGSKRPTYEFRESWKNEIEDSGSSITGIISQNYQMMNLDSENFIHGSLFYKDEDIREYLSEIINEGKSGPLFGNGFWRQPRPFWDEAMKIFEDGTIDKWIREEFKNFGFNLI